MSTQAPPDELEEFALPYFQRIALRLQVLGLTILARTSDLVLLLFRPRLFGPYLALWWAELRHTPYRARRTFEQVRAQQTTGQRFREFIYGETPLLTAIRIFRRAGVGPESSLVDLGAGRGRVLLAARWLGARARGIELLEAHVKWAAPALARAGAVLELGDMLQVELGEATHVFTNWLALSDETKARLVAHLRSCRPGTRIITVTRPIEAGGFRLRSRHFGMFTWGFEQLFIHERVE